MTDYRKQSVSRLAVIMTAGALSFVLSACQTIPSDSVASSDLEQYSGSAVNIASLSEVIERNPNAPGPYNVRGTAYGKAGRYEQALSDFNKAIELDPNFFQAYANRALVYRRLGRQDLALRDYDRAIVANPRYAQAYIGRGKIHCEAGRTTKALSDFERAVQVQPDEPAGFPQPCPHLPEPRPAFLRDRGLFDGHRPQPGCTGTLPRARAVEPCHRQQQGGAGRFQPRCRAKLEILPGLDRARHGASNRSARRAMPAPPISAPWRSITPTSRPSRAPSAPAAPSRAQAPLA